MGLFVIVDVIILTVVTPLFSTRLKPEIVPDREFGSTVNVNDYEMEGTIIMTNEWFHVAYYYSKINIMMTDNNYCNRETLTFCSLQSIDSCY